MGAYTTKSGSKGGKTPASKRNPKKGQKNP